MNDNKARPLSSLSRLSGLTAGLSGSTTGAKATTAPLGSFAKGGKVPKTGVYQLEKGEKVTPAEEAKETPKEEAKEQSRNSEYRKVFLTRRKKPAGK